MAEQIEKKKDKRITTLDVVSNIYREATDYDIGKVLTIAKSVVSTLQQNDYINNIAKNNVGSLVNCVRQAIDLGLTIDANGYCYMIPYKGKLTLQVGYKGYLYKILKSYPNVKIQACLVKEGDEVNIYKKENNDYVDHKYSSPFGTEEKKIIGVYSIITFSDGKSIIETLNKKDLDLIKSKTKTKDYDKYGKPSVWLEWYGEMCKKSVLKRACKIHFSAEVSSLNEFDNKMYDITPKAKKLPKSAGLEEANE